MSDLFEGHLKTILDTGRLPPPGQLMQIYSHVYDHVTKDRRIGLAFYNQARYYFEIGFTARLADSGGDYADLDALVESCCDHFWWTHVVLVPFVRSALSAVDRNYVCWENQFGFGALNCETMMWQEFFCALPPRLLDLSLLAEQASTPNAAIVWPMILRFGLYTVARHKEHDAQRMRRLVDLKCIGFSKEADAALIQAGTSRARRRLFWPACRARICQLYIALAPLHLAREVLLQIVDYDTRFPNTGGGRYRKDAVIGAMQSHN